MVRRLRTAVLVVHGMGSQRPLETVRGIVDAVWFDQDDHTQETKRAWSHPQPSGVDIDLTVTTTNDIPETKPPRIADFHELYWAHLMSETKAVAVLLWLFELARQGPNLKAAVNGLWWCATVFLSLLLLSATLVVVRALTWFADVVDQPQGIIIAATLMVVIGIAAMWGKAVGHGWQKLPPKMLTSLLMVIGAALAVVAILLAAAWGLDHFKNNPIRPYGSVSADDITTLATNVVLVPSIALLTACILMGRYGRNAFWLAYALSSAFFLIYLAVVIGLEARGHTSFDTVGAILREGRVHWSLTSDWSVVAACLIIGVYAIVNTLFLQPYLGDAARYFRNSPANVAVRREIRKQAVKTLDQLHRSRDYDRIIVVAHSLGSVVAYDMLRAYYSRVCPQIPVANIQADPAFDVVNNTPDGQVECGAARKAGRHLIAEMAKYSKILLPEAREGNYEPAPSTEVDAWLVTDFVTLGSPLTHAQYLMAHGETEEDLDRDFERHVREREYPTCPPAKLDNDGRLTFKSPYSPVPNLHHGGIFGFTRWSNLYFPMTEVFFGDAIGGPLRQVFGACVKDVPVSAHADGSIDNFMHVAYWDIDYPGKRTAPHIAALREAVDLADREAG